MKWKWKIVQFVNLNDAKYRYTAKTKKYMIWVATATNAISNVRKSRKKTAQSKRKTHETHERALKTVNWWIR